MESLKSIIRDVPDFPKPGIVFKDITPVLADPRALHIVLDSLAEQLVELEFDTIVGIESRGFIFGVPLAVRLNKRFVPVRRPGKLPCESDKVSYSLEYGTGQLEIHRDAIQSNNRVVVVDDLLATGGTAAASAELIRLQGTEVLAFAFVIELGFLRGAEALGTAKTISLLNYD